MMIRGQKTRFRENKAFFFSLLFSLVLFLFLFLFSLFPIKQKVRRRV